MQVILECIGEAPVNATVTIQCNETGEVYSNTHLVEYAHRPMNIMGSVSVPRYEQCSLKIVFSNTNGSSEPFIKPLSKLFIMCVQLSMPCHCLILACVCVCASVCMYVSRT